MKKLFALLLAVAMVMGLATNAFAEEAATYSVSIQNDNAGHTYEAYQIFSGVLNADGSKLSDVQWGASMKLQEVQVPIPNTDPVQYKTENLPQDFLDALHASDEVVYDSTTLGNMFSAATDVNSMTLLLGTVSNNSAALNAFMKLLGTVDTNGDHLYLDNPVATTSTHTTVTDNTGSTAQGYVISGLPAGYYLIKDKENTLEDTEDFYTQYIVRLVNDQYVFPKGSPVTHEKGINDTLNGTYTNISDFDIGDEVYFKLQATLPSNLDSYDEYNLVMNDTWDAGLSFENIESIYLEVGSSNVYTFFDYDAEVGTTDPNGHGYGYITGTAADGSITYDNAIEVTVDETNRTLKVDWKNLLGMYSNARAKIDILPQHTLVVKYKSILNRHALIEMPNSNEYYVIYDNNPNNEGQGKTTNKEAHAFTFSIKVDKYDASNEETKLEGVEFKLYEILTVNGQSVNNYAKVITEEMIAAKEVINGVELVAEDLGKVYDWTTDVEQASVLDTDANGSLTVKGLDKGMFYLVETKAKDGYNTLSAPVQIQIKPVYGTDDTGAVTVTVTYAVDTKAQSSNEVDIANSQGSVLPTTGGAGTTMFYIAGAALVAFAVIMLITKKRMASAE